MYVTQSEEKRERKNSPRKWQNKEKNSKTKSKVFAHTVYAVCTACIYVVYANSVKGTGYITRKRKKRVKKYMKTTIISSLSIFIRCMDSDTYTVKFVVCSQSHCQEANEKKCGIQTPVYFRKRRRK